MLTKTKHFMKQSIIGGLLIISPFAVLILLFDWIFSTIRSLISPFTSTILKYLDAPAIAVDVLAILIIMMGSFLVGTIVSTTAGKIYHKRFDGFFERFAPGYRIIRDIITQLFGNNDNSPFKKGTVAYGRIFGGESSTLALGIITDTLEDGRYTFFCPTGPNPTSGFIYILEPDCCELREDISLDVALKTIISAGSGMSSLPAPKSPNG